MHLPAPGHVPVLPGLEQVRLALFSSVGLAEADAEFFGELVDGSGSLHSSATEGAPPGTGFASYRGWAGVHLHGKSVVDEPWAHYRLELSSELLDQGVDEEWPTVWPQMAEVLAEHSAVLRFTCRTRRERVSSIVQPLPLPDLEGFSHMSGCRFAKTEGDRPDGDELYSLLIDHSRDKVRISGRLAAAVALSDSLFEEPWKFMRSIMDPVLEFQ